MPPVLRFGVFAIVITSACAVGYFIRHNHRSKTAAVRPPQAVAQSAPQRALKTDPPTVLLPPVAVHEPPKPEPVDPNDPAFQMIKNELGIKTTVLDNSAPPPIVLTDAKKDVDPMVPSPPIPMTGPPPKLEMTPPLPDRPIPPMPSARRAVPLLNSRDAELDFEVTKAGLSKIKAVELWTTRDGGATWSPTDRMDGARPPFRTRLGSEGEYGFKLVFESESGMRTPEPRPGQPPELLMGLDTTPPKVVIHPPRPMPGQPGKVVLSWSATDANLDRDPAATRLEYSADGQTWQPIELPPAPLGRDSHEWSLPPDLPSRIFLRLTARDKAGNVATAVTNEKVSVDLVAPEGKLTGVRIQGHGPEPGPMPRDVEVGAAADGPIPAVLRSVLPALLNSPEFGSAPSSSGASDLSYGPASAQDAHLYWCRHQEALLQSLVRAESAKAWVEAITNTSVAEVRPRPDLGWPDANAVPPTPELLPAETERLLALLHGEIRVFDPAEPGVERRCDTGVQMPHDAWFRRFEQTLLFQEWRRVAEATFRRATRGETVLELLTDRDWHPSTAKPQRYRCDGPTFGDRPFGGVFDTVTGFWGTTPVGGVRLDF